MYQETITPTGGRKFDVISILSLVLLLLAIEFAGAFFNHLDQQLSWIAYATHLVAFIIFALFCALFYFKRLRGYRYTIYSVGSPENDIPDNYSCDSLEDDGNIEIKQNVNMLETQKPYPSDIPVGTFTAESVIGDSGTYIEIIAPHELRALISYTSDDSRLVAIKNNKNCRRATRLSRKTASVLIYQRDGVDLGLLIHPSDALAERLQSAIAANRGKL